MKQMGDRLRRWRLHRKTGANLDELAAWINPIVRGWMNYYGRFRRSDLYPILNRINTYLMRWARRKYKRLSSFKAAITWWDQTGAAHPALFTHWAWTRYNTLTR